MAPNVTEKCVEAEPEWVWHTHGLKKLEWP